MSARGKTGTRTGTRSGRIALVAVSALASTPAWGRAPHRVSIDVRGPLALIEVERPLIFGEEYGRAAADEVVVDLALPADAALAGAEVRGPARSLRLKAGPPGDASRSHDEAVRAAGWRAPPVPRDEGVDWRVQVAGVGLGDAKRAAAWSLRYRFVAPLGCRDGRLALSIPGSLDPAPSDAEVTLRVELGRVGFSGASAARLEIDGQPVKTAGGAVARARTSLSVRRAWELTIAVPVAGPQAELGTAFAAASSTGPGQGLLAVALCRPGPASLPPAANQLLLLIDRSRSVGPGGAAVARDLARALVLALPPTLAFNAVFFDRIAEPLFPVPRSATLEALEALEGAVGLGSLRNGTDVSVALRKAAALAPADGPPSYWVVITDGALADEDTPARLAAAVQGLKPDKVEAAMLVLRQDGDETAATGALRALAEVPARLGGLVRDLPASRAIGAAVAVVDGLRGPGDVITPVATAEGVDRPLPLQPVSIAPGAGGYLLARVAGAPAGRLVVRTRHGGAAASLAANLVQVGPTWARPLLPGGAPLAWSKADAAAAALMAPAPADAAVQEPPALRGRMERDVVQRALGYAFLPRARACYLTRAIKTAADFQLKGRLRLELHLERGEMMAAAVRRSTLGRPDIEACLREAAFAVEVPRALHSDAPVIAALNLVFRPRTEARTSDASAGDDAIDRILGPMPPSSDPLELLIEDTALRPAP